MENEVAHGAEVGNVDGDGSVVIYVASLVIVDAETGVALAEVEAGFGRDAQREWVGYRLRVGWAGDYMGIDIEDAPCLTAGGIIVDALHRADGAGDVVE